MFGPVGTRLLRLRQRPATRIAVVTVLGVVLVHLSLGAAAFGSSPTPYAAVSAGGQHACAVANGAVSCWGGNLSGQLGDGSTANSGVPIAVTGISTADSVSAGGSHTCATLADHSVRCWGNNDDGQLGDGSNTERHLPVSVQGINSATEIALGAYTTCALLQSGSVNCWGSGGLGNGVPGGSYTPVAVQSITTAVHIAAGGSHACAVLQSGGVKCWGSNTFGQLGNGTSGGASSTPVDVQGIANAVSVTAGQSSTCALLDDGTIKCWGGNFTGLVGDGTDTQRASPVAVQGISNATSVSTSQFNTCATLNSGSVKCWGSNYAGQLGAGNSGKEVFLPVAVKDISTATEVDVGGNFVCVRLLDGTLKCWGPDQAGQLGDGGIDVNSSTPVSVIGVSTASSVSLGEQHACALLTSGSVRCWGSNYNGQLGDDSNNTSATPISVPGIGTATGVSAGGAHSCAALSDGTVKCWGANFYGALGNGTISNFVNHPVAVAGITTAIAVAAGGSHTCALTNSGGIQCWGNGGSGRLGNGSFATRSTPAAVSSITNAVAISAGVTHSCALLATGSIKCWGWGASGALGNGSTATQSTPVDVQGITTATAISSSQDHVCALLTSGTVSCWGDGPGAGALTPQAVGGISNATAVGTGASHTCVVLSGGTAQCWGLNSNGELGDGTTTDSSTPVAVAGVSGASKIAGGGSSDGSAHSCVVLSTGAVNCWGSGFNGQLGDGVLGFRTLPVSVTGTGGGSLPDPPIAPGQPTAQAGETSATVTWTAPSSDGGQPIYAYTVTATPGGKTCSWSQGPLTCKIDGLEAGSNYTFIVTASTIAGTSPGSSASNTVVPTAPSSAPPVQPPTTGGNSDQGAQGAPASHAPTTTTTSLGARPASFGRGRPIASPGGAVAARISCPATATAACSGRLLLLLKAKQLGTGKYSIAPGKTAVVRVKPSRAGKSQLKRKKTLKVVLVLQDGNRKTLATTKVTLRAR